MTRLFITNGSRSTECMAVCVNEKREDTSVKSSGVSSMLASFDHTHVSSLLFIIIEVCSFFVVLIIQIPLLLQHASEIQSSEMLFVAVSQYYNIVFSLNCTVMSFV